MNEEYRKHIEKSLRKQRYYDNHPKEAHADRLKHHATKSDDFIMEKVEKWEKEQGLDNNTSTFIGV